MYKYTIDENNTVTIEPLDVEAKIAKIYQPIHPEGREWLDSEEATQWADEMLEQLNIEIVEEAEPEQTEDPQTEQSE
jgi:hypothetical protein